MPEYRNHNRDTLSAGSHVILTTKAGDQKFVNLFRVITGVPDKESGSVLIIDAPQSYAGAGGGKYSSPSFDSIDCFKQLHVKETLAEILAKKAQTINPNLTDNDLDNESIKGIGNHVILTGLKGRPTLVNLFRVISGVPRIEGGSQLTIDHPKSNAGSGGGEHSSRRHDKKPGTRSLNVKESLKEILEIKVRASEIAATL